MPKLKKQIEEFFPAENTQENHLEEGHSSDSHDIPEALHQEIVEQVALQLKLLTETAEANGITPEDLLLDPSLLKGLIPEDAPLTLAASEAMGGQESETQNAVRTVTTQNSIDNADESPSLGEQTLKSSVEEENQATSDRPVSDAESLAKLDFSKLTAASADALAQALKPMLAGAQMNENSSAEDNQQPISEGEKSGTEAAESRAEESEPSRPQNVQSQEHRGTPSKSSSKARQLQSLKKQNDVALDSEDESPKEAGSSKSSRSQKSIRLDSSQSKSNPIAPHAALLPFAGLPLNQMATLLSSMPQLFQPAALSKAPVASKPPIKKSGYAPKACVSCKLSHVACDESRPCERCVRAGKADTCRDAVHKKRGRPTNQAKRAEAAAFPISALNRQPSRTSLNKAKFMERLEKNSSLPPGFPAYLLPLTAALQQTSLQMNQQSSSSSVHRNKPTSIPKSVPSEGSKASSSSQPPTQRSAIRNPSSLPEKESSSEMASSSKNDRSSSSARPLNPPSRPSGFKNTPKPIPSSSNSSSELNKSQQDSTEKDSKASMRRYPKKFMPSFYRETAPSATFRPLLPSIFPSADPQAYQKFIMSAIQSQLGLQKSDTEYESDDVSLPSQRRQQRNVPNTKVPDWTQQSKISVEEDGDEKPQKRRLRPRQRDETPVQEGEVSNREEKEDSGDGNKEDEARDHGMEDDALMMQAVQALQELLPNLPELAAFTQGNGMEFDGDGDENEKQAEHENQEHVQESIHQHASSNSNPHDNQDSNEQVRLFIEAVSQEQEKQNLHSSEESQVQTPHSGLSIEDLQALFDEPHPPPPPRRSLTPPTLEEILSPLPANPQQQESQLQQFDIPAVMKQLQQNQFHVDENHVQNEEDESHSAAVAAVMKALQAAHGGDEATAARLWDEIAAVAADVLPNTSADEDHDHENTGEASRKRNREGDEDDLPPSKHVFHAS